MRILAVVLIVIGTLLMIGAPMWPKIAKSEAFRDDQTITEYSQSVANLHHTHSESAVDANLKEQRIQATKSFEEQQAKINSIRQFRQRGVSVMRWSGTISAVAGIIVYLLFRPVD